MTGEGWPVGWSALALVAGAVVLVVAGVRFTRVVDRLADRTGLGEALAGAILLGATTSLPGLVTTTTVALEGDAGFAVSNAVGGIAVQTTFLAIADITYRKVNLEHAAASLPNLVQSTVLIALLALVIGATGSPDVAIAGVHPATLVLVGVYLYGMRVSRSAGDAPEWAPNATPETVEDAPEETPAGESLARLWGEAAVLAAIVAAIGWMIGQAGLSIAEQTALTGPLVGALFTGVITSLPELVTAISAVRIGALTLAVGDIIGGNTFDVLFVAVGDVAFRGGSIYHAIDTETLLMLALTIVLTAVLTAGLLRREKRGIGFEGVAILGFYALGVLVLAVS